ncbi:protein of unknown function [Flavobacteriaceae bacterium MAR_2010_188]|nr:protein of unknown function [Flavobacteriaceae bacterium MAR_2010_188]
MSETIISIALGIGLSASVGFRIFVPLLALSAASYFGLWELNESWQWIGSLTSLVTFGIATLLEIAAYMIPFVDNLLDTIAIPLASVAGTAVMVSTVADLSPVVTWALAIIAGGGTAAAIKGTVGGARLTSSASTAGLANPVISVVESLSSIAIAIISIFLPIVAIILAAIIIYFLFRLYRKIKPKAR